MIMKTRVLAVFCALFAFGRVALAFQPPAGQGEFLPVSQLPPAEQLDPAPQSLAFDHRSDFRL